MSQPAPVPLSWLDIARSSRGWGKEGSVVSLEQVAMGSGDLSETLTYLGRCFRAGSGNCVGHNFVVFCLLFVLGITLGEQANSRARKAENREGGIGAQNCLVLLPGARIRTWRL